MKTVLILHQDPKILESLRKGFEKYADLFQTSVTDNPVRALDIVAAAAASLLITDIRLLKADDYDFLSTTARLFPDLTVLAMLPPGHAELKDEALSHGARAFIESPFRIDALADMVKNLLTTETDGGELRKVSPGMFIQLIQMEEKTCTVRVTNAQGACGVLFFERGELMDARLGVQRGEEVARRILTWDDVSISMQLTSPVKDKAVHTDVQALLLDAMREKDEAAKSTPSSQTPENEDRPAAGERIAVPVWEPKRKIEPSDGLTGTIQGRKSVLSVDTLRTIIQAETGRKPGPEDIRNAPEARAIFATVQAAFAPFMPGPAKAACVEPDGGPVLAYLPTTPPAAVRVPSKALRDRMIAVLGELE